MTPQLAAVALCFTLSMTKAMMGENNTKGKIIFHITIVDHDNNNDDDNNGQDYDVKYIVGIAVAIVVAVAVAVAVNVWLTKEMINKIR